MNLGNGKHSNLNWYNLPIFLNDNNSIRINRVYTHKYLVEKNTNKFHETTLTRKKSWKHWYDNTRSKTTFIKTKFERKWNDPLIQQNCNNYNNNDNNLARKHRKKTKCGSHRNERRKRKWNNTNHFSFCFMFRVTHTYTHKRLLSWPSLSSTWQLSLMVFRVWIKHIGKSEKKTNYQNTTTGMWLWLKI